MSCFQGGRDILPAFDRRATPALCSGEESPESCRATRRVRINWEAFIWAVVKMKKLLNKSGHDDSLLVIIDI